MVGKLTYFVLRSLRAMRRMRSQPSSSNQFCLPLGLRLYPSCSTPPVFSPFSTVLLQVLFARPDGRLPFGCRSVATARSLFFRFLSTCPVQLQQCLLMSPLILFVPLLTSVFWFVILLCGHLPSSYPFQACVHVFISCSCI